MNLCEGPHIYTELGLLGFKSGPDGIEREETPISLIILYTGASCVSPW